MSTRGHPLRAGAAAVSLDPGLGLPMFGFVRRQEPATGMALPLEATAVVIESDQTLVVLCGVDTLGLSVEQSARIRSRIASDLGTHASHVLLNWNHTHNAPPAGNALLARSGLLATRGDEAIERYGAQLEQRVVQVVVDAAESLERAAATWGVGEADLSVNRRERDSQGRIVHGWRVDGAVDQQVVTLQFQRPDSSPIATVVGFGCHPVAVGMDFPKYSSDYPGAVREVIRKRFGGEVVFFQCCAGNVLPRVAFDEDEGEAMRMGERIAIEAAHSVADAPAWPTQLARVPDASLIPMKLLRHTAAEPRSAHLTAAERTLDLPYGQPPSRSHLEELVAGYDADLSEAIARGAGSAERFGIEYHRKWAHVMLDDVSAGAFPTSVAASMGSVRIGDGAIVTAPGELFTELGWAIKIRSPATPTLVAGYTNGAVGYLPTPEAYTEGGYEPAYSNRSYGTASTVASQSAWLIVEAAVRMLEEMFPDRTPFDGGDWLSIGTPLPHMERMAPVKPPDSNDDSPDVVRAPG